MIKAPPFINWSKQTLGYFFTLGLPLGFWLVALVAFKEPLSGWLSGGLRYEQDILREWLEEARAPRKTLPALIEGYLDLSKPGSDEFSRQQGLVKREEIREHLRALGEPPTKVFAGQLPLFPQFFEITVVLVGEPEQPIRWAAGIPFQANQCQFLEHRIHPGALVRVYYQVHAYDQRAAQERLALSRAWRLGILAALVTLSVTLLTMLSAARERARKKVTEKARLEAEAAEHRRLETEKQLLSQQLATEEAQKKALELRSQMYAGIGIMAGSYAHNIKNLLVRPMDLLRRCQEATENNGSQKKLLGEVSETLAAVTNRLQQILAAVRKEPGIILQDHFKLTQMVQETVTAWQQLASEKWKAELRLAIPEKEIFLPGDSSHLQQVLENLIFNARDATFEQRNHLREEARKPKDQNPDNIRQSLLEAAAWKGEIQIKIIAHEGEVVLLVSDNGAGMTNESLSKCTDAYYSTRRDSAIYEGMSSGMGLGLSFVKAVLDSHNGKMEIVSNRWHGSTFKITLPQQSAQLKKANSGEKY